MYQGRFIIKNLKSAGFSLFEMLIALSLVLITLFFAIPNVKTFLTRTHADLSRIQLWRALQYARVESIARNVPIFLKKNQQWGKGFIIYEEETPIYTFEILSASGVIYWRAFPANHDYLEFLPTGFLNAENGTFWYCDLKASNPAWAIAITQEARARLIVPNKNNEVWLNETTQLSC